MFRSLLSELPIMLLSLPAILFSLSFHEMSHGYVAYRLGDPTARSLGRLSLNPLRHIDPIGFICMILFRIGWAKPVPVNARYFKKPRRDMALTAAAGPLSNLFLALVFTLLLRLLMIPVEVGALPFSSIDDPLFIVFSIFVAILYLGVSLNLSLMFFNLIPVPPLDGSRIAYIFLPQKVYFGLMKYERYIMIGFLILFFFLFNVLPQFGISITSLSELVMSWFFRVIRMPEKTILLLIVNLLSKFSF